MAEDKSLLDVKFEKKDEQGTSLKIVPEFVCNTVKNVKSGAELVVGSVFNGLSSAHEQLVFMKYGPFNFFRKNEPDYRALVAKWDKQYEAEAKEYAVLPDWPVIREIGRLKSYWHQFQFMRYENHYVYHTTNMTGVDAGFEFNQRYRAFTPGNNILNYQFYVFDYSDNLHPQGRTCDAEATLQVRNMSQVTGILGNYNAMEKSTQFDVNKNKDANHTNQTGLLKMCGIRPRILKTEDYNWHANGLLYPLESSMITRQPTPIFANEEQERKFMGRWFSYKESIFGKKFTGGADTPDERYMDSRVYSSYSIPKPLHGEH